MNSFTIYKEYYDLITLLPEEEQQELVLAIMKYMFEDIETELNDRQIKIFKNLKRPLDISKKNSKRATKEKPKENQKGNQKGYQKETHQDVNVYVNVNNNKTNSNNIFSIIENNFGRTIAPLEVEVINGWITDNISEELIVYAIQIAVCNNAYSIKYVDAILQTWKREKITTIAQAKKEQENFKEKKNKKVKLPDWFDEDVKKDLSAESEQELEDLLKEFK